MNEDFLHHIWKYKKFDFRNLKTTDEQEIIIKRIGDHNQSTSGPDFFNAQLIIDDQRWAGNIEIHSKASDWYVHHHEIDVAYDTVILHVVWEDDIEIFRKNNSKIPTLELKGYVDDTLFTTYQQLFLESDKKWIPCEKEISNVSGFTISHWQEQLYVERLEEKAVLITEMLMSTSNDWESVLFKLLAKNFGLNINKDAFLSMANSINFSVVRKCSHHLERIEALFFGQSGLLAIDSEDRYVRKLQREYNFLRTKFTLTSQGVVPFHFFRLRPSNFPTIRIAQLASLYHQHQQLFTDLMNVDSLEGYYQILEVETSPFWQTHYTFNKDSSARKKKLTKSFIELLLINTIIPLKFVYNRSKSREIEDELFRIMSQLAAEKNTIVNKFTTIGVTIEDAVHSQAMIQLKKAYCDQKKCLQCAIGNYLVNQGGSLG